MIDKVKQTILQAGDLLKEQAGSFSGSALERLVEIFEDWATVFPRLETYGLTMINFSLSVGLSPGMIVLMTGLTADFEEERIKELLEINAGDKTMLSVLRTLQTSGNLYRRTGMPPFDDLQLKIVIGLPPEIKVTFGQTEFS